MDKDRIQIDGVWYVRETKAEQPIKKLQPNQITNTINSIYETGKYCFEALMIYRDDLETLYPDVSIEFTDKRPGEREDWKTDYLDNPNWMRGVFHGNEESMIDARETMDQDGIDDFRAFLKYLETRGWIDLNEEE